MKLYRIERFGSVDGLKVVEEEDPQPGDHEVLVRIRAASLNYRDLVVLRGQYDRNPQPGRVPLSDGAGEVIVVGRQVTEFKAGDAVAGCFFQGWEAGRFRSDIRRTALGGGIDGVLAELVLFEERGLVHLPADYTFEEGATLPCAALRDCLEINVSHRTVSAYTRVDDC